MAENGCSLEDCHTNLFALTDLAGIKWRRLSTQSDATFSVDPLEDPVLSSYSKCVQADLLCVWRRQPKISATGVGNKHLGDHGPASPKELWLFWYGEEPSSLPTFISQDLYEVESGSWESGPLSYECRTLLFKALHNLIERSLLSQSFVRVGKWFVQPYNSVEQLKKDSVHLSLSFNFFLHGDSTVCASVDVRQHSPLFILSNNHIDTASQLQNGTPVMLAPYGLSGHLTGRTSGESDPKTHQLLEDWKRFYHINKSDEDSSSSLPSVVEVIVAGVRLRYPSSYILVALDVEMDAYKMKQMSSPSMAPQNSTINLRSPFLRVHPKAKLTDVRQNSKMKLSFSKRIVEKSWQDWIVASGHAANSHTESLETLTDSANATAQERTLWRFGDPIQKGNCGCTRTKPSKHLRNTPTASSGSSGPSKTVQSLSGFGANSLTSWKQQQQFGFKGDKGLVEHRPRQHKIYAPYHRRNKANHGTADKCGNTNYLIPPNFGLVGTKPSMLATSSFMSSSSSSNFLHNDSQGVLQSSKSLLHQMTGGLDSSPNSAAPSPLMATAQGQLSSISHNGGDPTMPTLSPQPLTKSGGGGRDGRSNSKECGFSESSMSKMSNVQAIDSSGGAGSSAFVSGTARIGSALEMKSDLEQSRSSNMDNSSSLGPKIRPANIGKTWFEKQMKKRTKILDMPSLKRPTLAPLFEDDNEGSNLKSLYELQTDATLEYLSCQKPNSSFKMDFPYKIKNDPLHFSDDAVLTNSRLKDGRVGIKEEYSSHLPQIKLEDHQAVADCRSNGYNDSKNAMDLPPSPTGRPVPMTTTLMRENDLIPNIQDLDKMFDTDEECDPDSPTTMTRPDKLRDDMFGQLFRSTSSMNHGLLAPNQGVLSTKELSRMYPTPPSADNPCSEPSPMMQGPIDSEVHHDNHHFLQQPPQQLQHQYSSLPYIKEELGSISATLASLKKEYSNLYRMPLRCKMPASTDYNPIELPQDNRPKLPPNLVYKPQTSTVNSLQHQPPERNLSASKFISSSLAEATHPINVANNRRPEFVTPFYMSQQHNNNMIVHHQQHLMQQQRTPLSYELMSPASNASSLSRPINSIDNSHPGSTGEVSGLVVNIVLSDSMLNIFKDHNFDSCTLCACNRNIDGSDINTYLVPHNRPSAASEDQFRCTCAFSAIINRRYGLKTGLFYEDEVEITGIYHNLYDNVYKTPLLINKNQDKQTPMGNNNQGSHGGLIEDEISQEMFGLLKDQFSTQFPSLSVLANFKALYNRTITTEYARNLEKSDCSEACYAALEFSRQMNVDNCTAQSFVDRKKECLHSWPFHQASAPIASNSQEVVRLLKQLQPVLQDAIQKKRTTRLWESVYTISGPLTWKDFHLLAGRGSKETSEPKSIPYLVVGFDKEWLALSPHAIKHWDKLCLEPLSEPRDVLYVVIAPENDLILSQVTTFFNELGVLYEQCKLGRHRVIHEKLKGGVMRIGRSNEALAEKESVELDDEWFKDIGNSPTAVKLRLYVKICCKLLVNLLANGLTEKRALYEEAAKSHSAAGGSRFSISNPDQPASSLYSTSSTTSSVLHPGQSTHPNMGPNQTMMQSNPFGHSESIHSSVFSSDRDHNEQSQRDPHSGDSESHEVSDLHNSAFSLDVVAAGQMPYVVIYVVDPFSSGNSAEGEQQETNRLAFLGILRMFDNMIKIMPEQFRSSIQLQIIPQQTVLSVSQPSTTQAMQSLCFSIYTACRKTIKHATLGRTLTGFGPASSANKLIKKLYPPVKLEASGTGVVTFGNMGPPMNSSISTVATSTLYCPPYILASNSGASATILPETWKEPAEKSGILLCAYCLSEDQRFLLATLVDATGELLETTCINIDVPNRSSRRRAAVRRFALQKLWDFILGVIACTTRAWRLVIGRFGRLGHGELKGWSTILSKRNLLASSHHLRRICQMCSTISAGQCPAILSACLVSTELHPSIHIMIDSVKKEENQSSKRQLSTPRDASCTHILVYPTSAVAQATDSSAADTHIDFTANELLNEEELLTEFGTEDQEMMSDFWGNLDNRMMEDDISPNDDLGSMFGGVDIGGDSNHSRGMGSQAALEQEESNNLNLLQQPQAMGFYVSTAQPGPLPQWFWSSCPQREGHCPVCFKASLHLHCPMVQQNQDDLIHPSNAHKKPTHPLDSYLTCDVLRYVLETYNTLSWLTIDPITNDRRSCLPVHMLILMQLYQGIKTFV